MHGCKSCNEFELLQTHKFSMILLKSNALKTLVRFTLAHELPVIQPTHQFASISEQGNLVQDIEPGPLLWMEAHGNTTSLHL